MLPADSSWAERICELGNFSANCWGEFDPICNLRNINLIGLQQSINIGPIFARGNMSAGSNNNNNNSTNNNNNDQSGGQNAPNNNMNNGELMSAGWSYAWWRLNYSTADNFASSLLSAFGLATASAPPPPPPATTNNQSSNNTNTTTTNTTASAGSNNQNQQGQLPRSRIPQLFVPISMNRSRRVIVRRSSG